MTSVPECSQEACRWGILGTAQIARKNWQAIRDAGNAVLVAVASRSLAKAEAFIEDCHGQVPHPRKPVALGSYEELLRRPEIEAVYIPLPTGLRKEWVIRAAEAGKHVLVEKPAGCSATDVAEILAACDRNNVQFMDGVMFLHGRRLNQLRGVLETGVGRVQHVATQFSFLADESFQESNIRAHCALEPFGCVGDLGWYCLRFILWAAGDTAPEWVTGRIHAETPHGRDVPPVPVAFSGTLEFAGGLCASYYCSFSAQSAQWAVVSGTNGLLQINDFVLPFSGEETRYSLAQSRLAANGCRFDFFEGRSAGAVREPANNAPGSQESALFAEFSRLVREGRRDPYWPRLSLLTQQVLDASMGSARSGGRAVRFQK